jgi:hypothetical protein
MVGIAPITQTMNIPADAQLMTQWLNVMILHQCGMRKTIILMMIGKERVIKMEREIKALAHNFMCEVLDSYTAVGYNVPWVDYLDEVLEITNKTIQEWKKEEIE